MPPCLSVRVHPFPAIVESWSQGFIWSRVRCGAVHYKISTGSVRYSFHSVRSKPSLQFYTVSRRPVPCSHFRSRYGLDLAMGDGSQSPMGWREGGLGERRGVERAGVEGERVEREKRRESWLRLWVGAGMEWRAGRGQKKGQKGSKMGSKVRSWVV